MNMLLARVNSWFWMKLPGESMTYISFTILTCSRTEDEMRKYPDEQPRRELYNIYNDLLINQSTPWVEISGGYEKRLRKAMNMIERLL
jgi:nicotinamide riboside kinase